MRRENGGRSCARVQQQQQTIVLRACWVGSHPASLQTGEHWSPSLSCCSQKCLHAINPTQSGKCMKLPCSKIPLANCAAQSKTAMPVSTRLCHEGSNQDTSVARTMIDEQAHNVCMALLGSEVHGIHVIHCKHLHVCLCIKQCFHTVHLHINGWRLRSRQHVGTDYRHSSIFIQQSKDPGLLEL